MVFTIAGFIRLAAEGSQISSMQIRLRAIVILFCAAVRFAGTLVANQAAIKAAAGAKKTLRTMLYEKLIHLGTSYHEKVATSEVIQVGVEGIDQLETYYGRYLPQFFYAFLAPLILFAVVSFLSLRCAVALFICVPLIPVSLAIVQTVAKRLLKRYWDQYATMGDTFLENI